MIERERGGEPRAAQSEPLPRGHVARGELHPRHRRIAALLRRRCSTLSRSFDFGACRPRASPTPRSTSRASGATPWRTARSSSPPSPKMARSTSGPPALAEFCSIGAPRGAGSTGGKGRRDHAARRLRLLAGVRLRRGAGSGSALVLAVPELQPAAGAACRLAADALARRPDQRQPTRTW